VTWAKMKVQTPFGKVARWGGKSGTRDKCGWPLHERVGRHNRYSACQKHLGLWCCTACSGYIALYRVCLIRSSLEVSGVLLTDISMNS